MLGKTPHDIICGEITHCAMAMLKDDKIPVRQIAEELHFSDQASFCKFFKKQMGIPPMVYRKKITMPYRTSTSSMKNQAG